MAPRLYWRTWWHQIRDAKDASPIRVVHCLNNRRGSSSHCFLDHVQQTPTIHRHIQQVVHHLELAERLPGSFLSGLVLTVMDLYQVAVLGLIKATKAYGSETIVPFRR